MRSWWEGSEFRLRSDQSRWHERGEGGQEEEAAAAACWVIYLRQ